ncbi:MAG: 5-formyltetrahydrofolate cyclo-ligase [Gammaproteobacteria bacterium]|nr:5-formyltetrahydrofolate cyclo-ligase [Gammaproteobacteria bacterium]
MTKAQLRTQMRRRRNALTIAEQTGLGHRWCARFTGLPLFENATAFAAYWPCRGEVDIRPLLNLGRNLGKSIFLPTVSATGMWFGQWEGTPPPKNRSCGLRQPTKNSPRLPNLRTLDFVIVPLLAFDRCGLRLGQGGGYYDRRFQLRRFQNWHKPPLIGAAYDFQEVATVPMDPWDVSLDRIVTNDEIITPVNR